MKKPLSSKERILRAMRKQETDFVPVSPRMWKYNTMIYGDDSLKSNLLAKKEFDFDPICYVYGSVPNLFDPIIPDEGILSKDVKFTCKKHEEGDFNILERRFDTPAGVLTDCYKIPLRGTYDITHNEYLIKSSGDLPKLRYLVTSPMQNELKFYNDMKTEGGDEVLVTPYVRSAFNDLAAVQSPVDSMMLAVEDPAFLVEMLEILQKPSILDTKAYLEMGAEIIFISGFHISLSVGWSPKNYRDYFLPFIKEIVDMVHDAGAVVHFYDDGKLLDILPMILESGIDTLSTCTPPPAGDFSFEKAKSIVKNKLTLMGYVDIERVLHKGTPELVEATVKEAIDLGAYDDAFILSSSDGILRQTPIENLRAYFKAGRKYGKR
jgi:uroporphyrinogen decarboxylase